MTDQDTTGCRPGAKSPGISKIDAERAAELVRRVRGEREEPFGPLKLVRAVIRPKKPSPS